jgi:ribosomal protein S18 acetylase RimI-like enzyme
MAKGGSEFVASARRRRILATHCDRLSGVEGTVIREAGAKDASAVARVHVASWRTTYRGVVPDAFLDGMSYEESENRWSERLAGRDRSVFTFVADVSGSIVGFASGGPRRSEVPEDFDGELYALYLLAEVRGTGIGIRLFRDVAKRLSSSGFEAVIAWVMAENRSARGFYEAFGGRLVGKDSFEIEGVEIEEVAYGWDDVRELVKAPA